MSKKKNPWLYIIIVVLILVIVAMVIAPKFAPSQADLLSEAKVTTGDISKYITATGNAKAKEQRVVLTYQGGEVTDLRFSEGDTVLKNQVIAVVNGEFFKAPYEGIITSMKIKKDDVLSPNTPLYTITDYSELSVSVPINESNYSDLKLNNPATITFSGIEGKIYNGTLSNIALDGVIANGSTLFNVNVTFDGNQDLSKIRHNMTTEVKIQTYNHENILTLPVKAVNYDGETPFVLVKSGEEYIQQEIKVGISDGINLEVLDGLKDGETVYFNEKVVSSMEELMNKSPMGAAMSKGNK